MIVAWTFSDRVEERSSGLRLVVVIWGFSLIFAVSWSEVTRPLLLLCCSSQFSRCDSSIELSTLNGSFSMSVSDEISKLSAFSSTWVFKAIKG